MAKKNFNDFRFEPFGGYSEFSSKYLTTPTRISADGEKCIVKVAEEHVFMTRYGYGLILDESHVVFLKDWAVSRSARGCEVLLDKNFFTVKEWGDFSDNFGENPENYKFETWFAAAKAQDEAGNPVTWRKSMDKYEKAEMFDRRMYEVL